METNNPANDPDRREIPEWVPTHRLLRYFSRSGFSVGSFVVNFERKESYVLTTDAPFFSDPPIIDDDNAVSWESTPIEERRIMANRFGALLKFVARHIPVANRDALSIVEHFHVRWNGMDTLMARKFLPLVMDDEGNVRIGLFLMVPSFQNSFGELTITYGERAWTYDEQIRSFKKRKKISLSSREKQMLLSSLSGVPVKLIAKYMDVTESTVRTLRDRSFSKMEARNLAEAYIKIFLYT